MKEQVVIQFDSDLFQHKQTKAVFVLAVISIVQLVPVSGQLNCIQLRKLNAYDNIKASGFGSGVFVIIFFRRAQN